jgi:trk system potassium uptake protein TrkH
MNLAMVLRILGLMLMLFSLSMLPPIGVALGYQDGHVHVFVASFVVVAVIGGMLWLPVRHIQGDLRLRDGFLVVAMFWFFLALAGAIPLIVTDVPELSFTDAVFEAVSGFTTTGATVIVGLDQLPPSILYYRQQIQWFGGIGIIVLAVALFPVLGVGGMSLYKADTPGPFKDQKLTPRITQTAKALWGIYAALTAVCALAYWLAGMTPFDAIGHAFSTLSTAGFSTHDASFAHFDSAAIDAIACIFMFIGGTSYVLHFVVARGRDPRLYWRDTEFHAYFWMMAVMVVGAALYLWLEGEFRDLPTSLRHASLQVISVQTSTGYLSTGFADWPGPLPTFMMLMTLVCACAGSTSGGMKVIRWVIVFRQGVAELKRLVHPSAEIPVKLGSRTVPERVVLGVAGFFAMYFVVFAVLLFLMMLAGLDQVTAWSAVAATINNVGPGLGDVAWTFKDVPEAAKWVGSLAMLIGRVEIFALILLLTPAFWER